MPWHLSKSDPRKVYDERHQVVCVCQTPDQAALIVQSVVGRGPTSVLRAMADPAENDTFLPDDCCGKYIAAAGRDGLLKSITVWTCPKCGGEWEPKQHQGVRMWEPKTAVMIFR